MKLVVGLVVVEAADDVVAIAPGERLGAVALVAVGLGVADQVEPVPAPLLAVVRRGEQAIDQLLVGRSRRSAKSFDERIDLLRRRRQPSQVVSDATNQAQRDRPASRASVPSLRASPG